MADKTLDNTEFSGVEENVPNVQKFGDGDLFRLIAKAWSEAQGWMKSTKAMEIAGAGVIVQVTTQQRNHDGTYAVAEALAFVPGAMITGSGDQRRIVAWMPSESALDKIASALGAIAENAL